MSQHFAFAPTPVLINNSVSRPLTFWDDNYAEVLPTAATKMRIFGYGPIFEKSLISDVVGVRGNAGRVEELRLSAANLTLAGVIPVNAQVRVAFNINSLNYEGEFARNYNYGAWEYIHVSVVPGETIPTFLAKLYNALAFDDSARVLRNVIDVPAPSALAAAPFSGTFDASGYATSLAVLPIQTAGIGLYFDIPKGFEITSTEEKSLQSPYVQFTGTVAAAITTKGYEGRGNYAFLKGVFTEEFTHPYTFRREETPVNGQLYTSFRFNVYNPDTHRGGVSIMNQMLSTQMGYQIYVNEASAITVQQQIADFLSTATTINAPIFYNEAQPMVAEAVAGFKL